MAYTVQEDSYTFCFRGFFLGDAASEIAVVTLASKDVAGVTATVPFITDVVTALNEGGASLLGSLLILTGDIGVV